MIWENIVLPLLIEREKVLRLRASQITIILQAAESGELDTIPSWQFELYSSWAKGITGKPLERQKLLHS